MTAQEVWEYWSKKPEAKFDDGEGGAYIYKYVYTRSNTSMLPTVTIRRNYGILGVDELLPIKTFMETDWYLLEEWKEVSFLEAIKAWVNGSQIKSVDGENEYIYKSQFLMSKEREQTLDLTEARRYKWYIKEKQC